MTQIPTPLAKPPAPDRFYVVPRAQHDTLVASVYRHRGYTEDESRAAAEVAGEATWHGIRTHNAIKALEVETKHGAAAGGCRPGAQIRRLRGRFAAAETWDAQRKLGQPVALAAIETCMRLADRFGVGQVSVDNAFHYLWGGAYVMRAAARGYIAYTNCSSTCAEVVPFLGRSPTLGTNPHSWAFPTQDLLGYPIVIDWATSVIAWGRVAQCRREGRELPVGAAVDPEGRPTVDPARATALLPFGGHKGYGLSLIDELVAGYIGGSLPTLRGQWAPPPAKPTSCHYFQVIHPESLSASNFAGGRGQRENVQAILDDIRGHGNDDCKLPGQIEAEAAARSRSNHGLLFSAAELIELNAMAAAAGVAGIEVGSLQPAI